MSNPIKTKVFKSGNSLAVRLPKSLGAVEGMEMVVREARGTFTFEPVEALPSKIDVSGFAGKAPWLKPLTPEDRKFEERELDWDLNELRDNG